MTVTQALLSFAVIALLLTITPGIDTALVLRSVLTRGRPAAVRTGLGIVTGAFVWGAAAAVGASALLAASALAYRLLVLAGAAYMVVLGVSMLVRTFRRAEVGPLASAPPASASRAYLTGLITNLLNPKVGVFYVATIPQFIPAHTVPVLMGLSLAAVHVVLTAVWFAALIAGGSVASRVLRSARALRIIDRVTGVVLIGFGARLALEPH
ncbi:LysE family translocator [uncultured Amnibacterium sp.]|uniref:LysE family translocator n=1 Tax=uncultured Amnibacterium sp. TaxID=1631851 RepID=UPI0035CA0A5C